MGIDSQGLRVGVSLALSRLAGNGEEELGWAHTNEMKAVFISRLDT